MHLTLFIPDLLPHPDAAAAIDAIAAAPVLRHMLGRGLRQRFPAIDSEAWLCQAFEVEQREDWPVAALTAAVDGLPAETGWWLRADPVHLQLHRSGSRVIAAPALTLDAIEAAALAAALNAHFTSDGIVIETPQPARWYIRQAAATAVTAPVLSALAGRALPHAPLSGSRASDWHRFLTEAQMVLHEHPVNQAREARGLPAINSVLPWGGGHKPAVPGRHFSRVWSDDPLAIALAIQSGADPAAAPASAALWFSLRPDAGDRHLITLERAHQAARYGGPEAWIRAVNALEELWLAPLWAALGDNRLQELVIVATGQELCLRCRLRPADRFRFWRRPLRWTALAGNAA